uniref:Uncharacterized protein n=1 Tax=Polynucleobacter necessarius subsp. necessarius (strain STIR1) TaxID=452638 RepID=B1XUT9_POLNS
MSGIGTAICQRLAKDGFKGLLVVGQTLHAKTVGWANKRP